MDYSGMGMNITVEPLCVYIFVSTSGKFGVSPVDNEPGWIFRRLINQISLTTFETGKRRKNEQI